MLLVLLGSSYSFTVLSQNLVQNGSFEEYQMLPYDIGHTKYIKYWEESDKSSDYFHKKALNAGDTIAGVPLNFRGIQNPRTGEAYAGMLVYNNEYIQAELLDSLQKGQLYFARFYVNLSDSASYSCRIMNMFLLEKKKTSNYPLYKLTQKKPSIINPFYRLLDDTINWMPISGFYKAKGGERFLLITGFSTPWSKGCVKRSQDGHVYYYIDDVSLYHIPKPSFSSFNGNTLDLSEILFDNDQSVLKKEYHAVLDQLYEFLINNNFLNINIWAYTSKEGTKERNARLSKERVEVIKTYLLNKGFDADRIKTVGKGYKDLDKRTVEIEFL